MTRLEMQLMVNVAGIVGHHFKNPLTPIQREEGNLRALLTEGAPELREQAEASLDVIRESLAELRKRVRRFNDLVRVDERREPVDLRRTVEDSLAENRVADMSSLAVEWTPPARPVVVAGSPGSLQALLDVLVANALEALARRGRLALRLEAAGGWALLRVADGAGGIPPQVLERLWIPEAKGKAGGFGCGLFFARNIARAHGGEIDVEASSADGTTMRVRLPLAGAAPEGGEPG